MASLVNVPSKTKTKTKTKMDRKIIQFFCPTTQKRKSLVLGNMETKTALKIKTKIEEIISCSLAQIPWGPDLAKWIADLPEPIAKKLVNLGLIPTICQNTRLGEFTQEYLAGRTDTKASTQRALLTVHLRIVEFFGAEKVMREVTRADADAFKVFLLTKYSPATAGRSLRAASQFFRAAQRAKMITENPFSDIKFPSEKNRSRMFFVTREMFDRLINACPDHQWKMIIALSRLGGIRTPSETLLLKWSDINWEHSKMLVHSPKTEHHEGKDTRWVPLFDDGLLQILAEGFEQARDGEVYVINRYRSSIQNLRTTFAKIIQRAGLTQWPKLFANMRSSRQTELAREGCPVHLLSAWIGNTEKVMVDHYLQIDGNDYKNASQWTPKREVAKVYAQPLQNRMQQGEDSVRKSSQELAEGVASCEDMRKDTKDIQNDNGRHRTKLNSFKPNNGNDLCKTSEEGVANSYAVSIFTRYLQIFKVLPEYFQLSILEVMDKIIFSKVIEEIERQKPAGSP